MESLPPAARQALAAQDGVIAGRQLIQAGVSPDAIRWNAGRHWRVLLPSIYLISRQDPRERQRQIAALLWAGPDSALAGSTAAAAYGIEAAVGDGRVQVVVPRNRSSRERAFVRVRRSALMDPDVVVRGPLRLSSRARACLDACLETRSPRVREAVIIEAVQKQIATLDALTEWCERLRPRDAVLMRPGLAAARQGSWSAPEARMLELLQAHSWAVDIWCNPQLRDARGRALTSPDLWVDDVALAIMVHSHRFHSQGEDWDRTVEADDRLRAEGIEVVGLTPRRISDAPADVTSRVLSAYARARSRPRPHVIAVARTGSGTRSA